MQRKKTVDNFSGAGRPNEGSITPKAEFVLLLLTLLLAGCATVRTPPVAPGTGSLAACEALYQEVDDIIDNKEIRDHDSSPVPGFPYLRTTRLLVSLRDELIESGHWPAWIGHMAELDAKARTLEFRNLPDPLAGYRKDALLHDLDSCRERLVTADLTQPQRRARLRNVVRVQDDYVTWWRVLGLYPFTAPFVSIGISAWHNETHGTFSTELASLPVAGKLVRWLPISTISSPDPLNARQVGEILRRSLDPLGIPLPTGPDLDRLFATFAPLWEVDVVDENDHIGLLQWKNGPVVDVTRPTLYRKVSYTRFGGQILLQLNYIVWFPARPGNDIYAGKLDGINWRVTLGPDGEPWLYDAIHNCGCYHKFFPSHKLRLRSDLPDFYFEPPMLPQVAPAARERQPVVLRIAHHTHFIQRLYLDKSPSALLPGAQPLAWEEYDVLRSLPTDEGYRSLFGTHGLIAGTERSERFLLWPMGIRSPGAMRQWGHHSTAFVGRRHFDDAFLIELLFEKAP
ncbi:hypothetical protein [Nitrosospira sp. NpAV]|uniref:hypothetical protein n=1 Tax=Nitrosospira sp. NpAV TaxID=58133 RepID=UPI0006968BE2|nr:hypothetical protein [Nitrosospira sp. NpAV]